MLSARLWSFVPRRQAIPPGYVWMFRHSRVVVFMYRPERIAPCGCLLGMVYPLDRCRQLWKLRYVGAAAANRCYYSYAPLNVDFLSAEWGNTAGRKSWLDQEGRRYILMHNSSIHPRTSIDSRHYLRQCEALPTIQLMPFRTRKTASYIDIYRNPSVSSRLRCQVDTQTKPTRKRKTSVDRRFCVATTTCLPPLFSPPPLPPPSTHPWTEIDSTPHGAPRRKTPTILLGIRTHTYAHRYTTFMTKRMQSIAARQVRDSPTQPTLFLPPRGM